jgi:hypothetical protein
MISFYFQRTRLSVEAVTTYFQLPVTYNIVGKVTRDLPRDGGIIFLTIFTTVTSKCFK